MTSLIVFVLELGRLKAITVCLLGKRKCPYHFNRYVHPSIGPMTSLAAVPGTLVFPRFVVCPSSLVPWSSPAYLLPTVRPRSTLRVCTQFGGEDVPKWDVTRCERLCDEGVLVGSQGHTMVWLSPARDVS